MLTANNTTISMGAPIVSPVLIPVEHSATPACINEPFLVNGEILKVTCVSFGTPHAVVFMDDVDGADLEAFAPALSNHARFPKGASVVVCQMYGRDFITARLWRYGEGEASFAPEAACVAMAAARMLQKTGWEADVSMDGSIFRVKWDGADGCVYLTAPSDLLCGTGRISSHVGYLSRV